jgi:hypothetical protein
VLLHAAAVVAPVALYFYAAHPAWAWMYSVNPDRLAAIFLLPLIVGHAALVAGGWYAASLLLRRGYQGALIYATGGLALTLLILIVAGFGRLSRAVDYYGWQVGAEGDSVFQVKLGWAFLVALLALFGSAIYVAIELGRDGRRVRAR